MVPLLLVSSDVNSCVAFIDGFTREHPQFLNRIYEIRPEEGKAISIDQIRQLKKELVVSTQRLIIIYEFQTAKHESQNALLKTLEDQTDSNQFILCTDHIGTVLSTIISRCRVEVITPGGTIEYDGAAMQRALNTLLQDSSYAFMNDELFQVSTLEEAKELLNQIIIALHRLLRDGDTRLAPLISLALEHASLLRSNNLNPQLTIDSWCLSAKKFINRPGKL